MKRYPFQIIRVRAPKAQRRNRLFAVRQHVFRVRHGYIDLVKTEGCTDDDKLGVTPINIVIPSGVVRYRIWIETTLQKNRAHENIVHHGPDGWPGFPRQTGCAHGIYYTLIAEVSTDGDRLKVRPFVRGDVNLQLDWLAYLHSQTDFRNG